MNKVIKTIEKIIVDLIIVVLAIIAILAILGFCQVNIQKKQYITIIAKGDYNNTDDVPIQK